MGNRKKTVNADDDGEEAAVSGDFLIRVGI
jgi:hypothetical protein